MSRMNTKATSLAAVLAAGLFTFACGGGETAAPAAGAAAGAAAVPTAGLCATTSA